MKNLHYEIPQTYSNREDLIYPLIKNKYVLDVGSLSTKDDGTPTTKKELLFDFLKNNSKKVIGIDINANCKRKDIIKADIFLFLRKNKEFYDVIIIGDIIEHITNPGELLRLCASHLKKNGIIIITTPNIRSIQILFPYDDHTCWYSEETLTTLIKRSGLKVIKKAFYVSNRKKPFFVRYIPFMNKQMFFVIKK
jgi:2-polyprenyl-3-methyl-5-hydroxy-6-metoxy-1,4-benzoquinol methylase